MPMRITGTYSGLDTDTIISELVKAKSAKVDKLKKAKTKNEWKTEAWKEINDKIKNFYNKTVSNMRFSSSYAKKTSTVSNSSAVSVITGDSAMNGVQTLSVKELAKSGYLTGAKLKAANGSSVTSKTHLLALDVPAGSGLAPLDGEGSFTVRTGDKVTKVTLNSSMTVPEAVGKLRDAGLSANFDEKNGRIFVSAPSSGKDNDFSITADDERGFSYLTALGINVALDDPENEKTKAEYERLANLASSLPRITDETSGESVIDFEAAKEKILSNVNGDLYKLVKEEMTSENDYDAACKRVIDKLSLAEKVSTYDAGMFSSDVARIAGHDAEIELNGVTYTSDTNSIEVNGLTFTCLAKADDITITTQSDTSGIFDMIRDFFKEYNEIINELDKMYNAADAKGYEPLTDEEKDEMSDSEIEKWEKKVKDALFRKDENVQKLRTSLQDYMQQAFEVNGEKLYLVNMGIETASYFSAADNEKHAFHIHGDDKDSYTFESDFDLKSLIATDPEKVTNFFVALSRGLYEKLGDLSKATDYSSGTAFWDDKKMKQDISDQEEKIKQAEKKVADYEDRYYKKFSDMEVALSKLESQTSSLLSMFGQN